MRTAFFTILFAWVATSQTFARVGSIALDQLARESAIIVVAKVKSVSQPLIGKRYAKAAVVEVWKGDQKERVEFLASRTWTCDVSEARKGETVLLFLTKGGKSRSYEIAHSGRGRMPLRTVNGKEFATFWPDIRLPKGTPTIDGPRPEWDFIRSVEIAILRDLVNKVLENTEKSE